MRLRESSEQAVIREVLEETGLRFELDRLGYIQESFFIYESTEEAGFLLLQAA